MIRILKLENSQAFFKLSGKSQIIIAGAKKIDFYRTRQTHSYEVKSIAEVIAKNIGFDKLEELGLVCLAHDLGHSALGHEGAEILDKISKDYGISEGFSDNNNNLNIIEHNSLDFNNYELVSLIKYPEKLYKSQKKVYLPMLDYYVKEESKIWGRNLKRTVACNIMDIADEIAYSTSDLYDSFATGYTKDNLYNFLLNEADTFKSHYKLEAILRAAADSVKTKNKRSLRDFLLELKLLLINDIYWDYNLAQPTFKNKECQLILNRIISFNYKEFIKNKEIVKERKRAISKFEKFIKFYFECEPSKFPSELYKNKYRFAKTKLQKLKIRRDMVSDTSDQYVLSFKED